MLLWCLLVSQVEEEDAGEGTDEEDDVKPAVVEVELKLPKDFRDDGPVLGGHAHSDQQHRRDEVHALQRGAGSSRRYPECFQGQARANVLLF